jgi:hypothetical protein
MVSERTRKTASIVPDIGLHNFWSTEATSSLDAANEAEVEKALQNAFKGRWVVHEQKSNQIGCGWSPLWLRFSSTVIVVAHKLQSIQNGDSISVIADEKLVEAGTHEGLVFMHGQYYNLIKSQLWSRSWAAVAMYKYDDSVICNKRQPESYGDGFSSRFL